MINVSQGGREDGQCPRGVKGVVVCDVTCNWTEESGGTESPGKVWKRRTCIGRNTRRSRR